MPTAERAIDPGAFSCRAVATAGAGEAAGEEADADVAANSSLRESPWKKIPSFKLKWDMTYVKNGTDLSE